MPRLAALAAASLGVAALAGLAPAQLLQPSRGERAPLRRAVVMRRAQSVADDIARGRQLPVQTPIRADVLSRRGLVDLVRRRMAEETSPGELHHEGLLLKRLGLVDEDADYEAMLYDMFEDEVAGLYDTDDRTLYVLSDLGISEAMLTLWHEVVHALQDQNFQVGEREDALEDDGDRGLAFRSLCEGDATITSMLLQSGFRAPALDYMIPEDAETLRSMIAVPDDAGPVPDALLEMLMFPYVEGVLFVRRRVAGGSLEDVNALFRNPPQSSEQVMHFEKYDRGDAPVEVRFGEAGSVLAGHEVVYDDTFGELGVKVWIGQLVSRELAAVAAAGWGGDRIALLEPTGGGDGDGDAWAVWQTVWDPADQDHALGSSGEAIEFERAAKRALAARMCGVEDASGGASGERDGSAAPSDSPPSTWTLDAAGSGVAGVRRDGLRVYVAIGPPGRLRDLVAILGSFGPGASTHDDD